MIKQSIINFFKPTFAKVIIFVILFFISFFVFTVSRCPAGMLCELPDKFYRGFPFAFYSWNEYAEVRQAAIFIGNKSGGGLEISYYAIALNAVVYYLFASVAVFVYGKLKK